MVPGPPLGKISFWCDAHDVAASSSKFSALVKVSQAPGIVVAMLSFTSLFHVNHSSHLLSLVVSSSFGQRYLRVCRLLLSRHFDPGSTLSLSWWSVPILFGRPMSTSRSPPVPVSRCNHVDLGASVCDPTEVFPVIPIVLLQLRDLLSDLLYSATEQVPSRCPLLKSHHSESAAECHLTCKRAEGGRKEGSKMKGGSDHVGLVRTSQKQKQSMNLAETSSVKSKRDRLGCIIFDASVTRRIHLLTCSNTDTHLSTKNQTKRSHTLQQI